MESKIKLSVFVVTYNQEKYIRQCLDSILMQQVDFDYEVVIGEDHGRDNTRAICEEYAEKYPQVKLLPLTENLGIARNWQRVLSACKGEYIALCEGDDYWIDDLKLQKQVNLMERDTSIGYVFTKHVRLKANGERIDMSERFSCLPPKMSLHELIACRMIPPPTQTVCFRTSLLPQPVPDFVYKAELQQDMALLFLIASRCNIGFINEASAVFRIGGATSSHNPLYGVNTRQKLMQNLNAYTHFEYDDYLNNKNDDWVYLTNYYLNHKQRGKATYYFIKKIIYSLLHYPKTNLKHTGIFIKHYIKHIF